MSTIDTTVVNPDKNETICVDGINYRRKCIKTHVITKADDIVSVAEKYVTDNLEDGDVLFITEKAVACTQGRAIPLKDIHPRPLAVFLSKFVLKTPYGIGLAMPETMEMALVECGVLRILFAAVCSAVCKIFGKRGVFYNIAGDKARSIDGPCEFTLPPYNEYVVLGPADPDMVAQNISKSLGCPVLIADINDIGGNILGRYPLDTDTALYVKVLKDNPLGQDSEQTPMGLIRKEI